MQDAVCVRVDGRCAPRSVVGRADGGKTRVILCTSPKQRADGLAKKDTRLGCPVPRSCDPASADQR
ncbi:hypothetical protein BKA93DRAFT_289365 [Sparassis latifolia]